MNPASKPPSPQAISALLKRAGFNRSCQQPSRIRGLHEFTDGYQVASGYPDLVLVRHLTGFSRSERCKREMLGRYAPVIRAAGWAVTGPADEGWLELTVTAQEESR